MSGFVVTPNGVDPGWIYRDPSAVLDYWLDWASWLASGETISSATWTVPTGITRDSSVIDGAHTRIWVRGGTAGTDYRLTCHIVTSAGREDSRSMVLKVRAR